MGSVLHSSIHPLSTEQWYHFDLSGEGLVFSPGEWFFVGWVATPFDPPNPYVETVFCYWDYDEPHGKSWYKLSSLFDWTLTPDWDAMIRAAVAPEPGVLAVLALGAPVFVLRRLRPRR
jgi:hypothetical protein